MTHPCASHIQTCDHCALCEAGVCCAGFSAQQRTQLIALIQAERQATQFHQAVAAEAERRVEHFRQAVTAEAKGTVSLADLLHIEAERQVLGAALQSPAWSLPAGASAGRGFPAAQEAAASSPNPRKEAIHVPVARQP
jgi:hypothetical protein